MDKPNVVWGVRPLSSVLADQPLYVVDKDFAEAAHVAGAYLMSVPGGVRLTKYLAWESVDITCIRDLEKWEEKQREGRDSSEGDSSVGPSQRSPNRL